MQILHAEPLKKVQPSYQNCDVAYPTKCFHLFHFLFSSRSLLLVLLLFDTARVDLFIKF